MPSKISLKVDNNSLSSFDQTSKHAEKNNDQENVLKAKKILNRHKSTSNLEETKISARKVHVKPQIIDSGSNSTISIEETEGKSSSLDSSTEADAIEYCTDSDYCIVEKQEALSETAALVERLFACNDCKTLHKVLAKLEKTVESEKASNCKNNSKSKKDKSFQLRVILSGALNEIYDNEKLSKKQKLDIMVEYREKIDKLINLHEEANTSKHVGFIRHVTKYLRNSNPSVAERYLMELKNVLNKIAENNENNIVQDQLVRYTTHLEGFQKKRSQPIVSEQNLAEANERWRERSKEQTDGNGFINTLIKDYCRGCEIVLKSKGKEFVSLKKKDGKICFQEDSSGMKEQLVNIEEEEETRNIWKKLCGHLNSLTGKDEEIALAVSECASQAFQAILAGVLKRNTESATIPFTINGTTIKEKPGMQMIAVFDQVDEENIQTKVSMIVKTAKVYDQEEYMGSGDVPTCLFDGELCVTAHLTLNKEKLDRTITKVDVSLGDGFTLTQMKD